MAKRARTVVENFMVSDRCVFKKSCDQYYDTVARSSLDSCVDYLDASFIVDKNEVRDKRQLQHVIDHSINSGV